MPWRAEDEALLQRLEDEVVARQLFTFLLGGGASPRRLHPRVGGLVAELRLHPSASEATFGSAARGDVAPLARLAAAALDGPELRPELAHHLALFWGKIADALEDHAPDVAAAAWVRSFVAWFRLAEERAYLERLVASVAGASAATAARAATDIALPPERVPLEQVAEVARRADLAARDLAPRGRAALLALARTDEAARTAGAAPEAVRRARQFAERRRGSAIESALSVIADALDEANVRGELAKEGRVVILRAISVWSWTAHDAAVEHFVVDRLEKIGWELHRTRDWDALRYLLDPFRPVIESLAARIASDPSQLAYAAACAQMFVFLAELADTTANRIALADRAVALCPTHRNGRLVLAAALCDEALSALRAIVVVARRDELAAIEAKLQRAESLYPRTTTLPEAKELLERVKSGKLAL